MSDGLVLKVREADIRSTINRRKRDRVIADVLCTSPNRFGISHQFDTLLSEYMEEWGYNDAKAASHFNVSEQRKVATMEPLFKNNLEVFSDQAKVLEDIKHSVESINELNAAIVKKLEARAKVNKSCTTDVLNVVVKSRYKGDYNALDSLLTGKAYGSLWAFRIQIQSIMEETEVVSGDAIMMLISMHFSCNKGDDQDACITAVVYGEDKINEVLSKDLYEWAADELFEYAYNANRLAMDNKNQQCEICYDSEDLEIYINVWKSKN